MNTEEVKSMSGMGSIGPAALLLLNFRCVALLYGQ